MHAHTRVAEVPEKSERLIPNNIQKSQLIYVMLVFITSPGLDPFVLFLIFKFKFKFIDCKKQNSNSLTLQKSNSNSSTTHERIQIPNSIQPYCVYQYVLLFYRLLSDSLAS